MWTINNFLAYKMIYGWSTHEKLACSYCMDNNKAFTLMNGGKTFFFIIAIEGFFQVIINTEEVAPSILLGEEFYDVVLQYKDIVFDFLSSK